MEPTQTPEVTEAPIAPEVTTPKETLVAKVDSKLKLAFLKVQLDPLVVKAEHTFWQAASAFALTTVLVSHAPLNDWHSLAAGVLGAGFSAVKSLLVSYAQSV